MEMPGRKYASEAYRYDYQGQFAEKDGETGLHSFELRQWDARIARWNSTDPYGQYFSPYMGMGNNPISLVDPDGGFAGGGDPPISHTMLNEITLTSSGGGRSFGSGLAAIPWSSIPYDHQLPSIIRDYPQHQVQGQSPWVSRMLDVSNNAEAARNAAALTFSGYAKMPKGLKRGYAYKLSKVTNLKAGKIHQGLKSFAASGTKITRRLGPLGHLVNAGNVGYGIYQDGGQFGYNAQLATAGAVGGIGGAWVGAKLGAATGAYLGGAVGVWFGGVGVVPGAAVGSFVGGVVGGVTGGYYGSEIGESFIQQ